MRKLKAQRVIRRNINMRATGNERIRTARATQSAYTHETGGDLCRRSVVL